MALQYLDERTVSATPDRPLAMGRRTWLKAVGGVALLGHVGVGGAAAVEVCETVDADVMIVMDRSGSMETLRTPGGFLIYYPQKFVDAKAGANLLVDALGSSSQVGLVSYATEARLDIGLTLVDTGAAAVKSRINSLVAAGNTNIYDGIRFAHEELLQADTYPGIGESGNARSSVPKIMVVLSDGQANQPFGIPGSATAAINAAEAAKADGVRMFSIAYGDDADPSLMGDIASPGDAYDASNISTIESVFEQISEEICTVTNESPNVLVSGDSIDEGETSAASASFTDDDSNGPWTVSLDYGDGTSTSYSTNSSGTIDVSHAYGDDGTYTLEVLVTDEQNAVGSALARVVVGNLDPDVELDESDLVSFPTGDYFLGRVGVAQTHAADATDPGSDDLTFSWNDAAGSTATYYNDGSSPDLDQSPGGTSPFSASDSVTYEFASLGVQTVEVTVVDDDGGSDTDSLQKIVTGDDDGARTIGFWGHQVSGKGRPHYAESEMLALLAVVDALSNAFDGVDTLAEAAAALDTSGPGMRTKADSQLLAAWLNFVSGRVDWDEVVGSTTAGDRLTEADAVVADSGATEGDLEHAKDLAEAVNTHDE